MTSTEGRTHGIPDVTLLSEPVLGARRRPIPLPGGRFTMGTDDGAGRPEDEEGPAREVTVDPFAIGATTVTNADWREFASATGHLTDAERCWSHVSSRDTSPPLSPQLPRGRRQRRGGAPSAVPIGPTPRVQDLTSTRASTTPSSTCRGATLPHGVRGRAGVSRPRRSGSMPRAEDSKKQARYPWGDELLPGRALVQHLAGHLPDAR